jgi:hypothetical protein
MGFRHKVVRVTPEWTPDTYQWEVRPIKFSEDYLSAEIINSVLGPNDTVVSVSELADGDLLVVIRFEQ